MKNNWTRLKERLIPELKAVKDAKTLKVVRSAIKNKSRFKWIVFYEIPYYLKFLNIVLFDIHWEIKYRTTDRYHIVNTKLHPSYYDSSTLMLHACFSLLEDYIVSDLGGEEEALAKKGNDPTIKEALILYRYWQNRTKDNTDKYAIIENHPIDSDDERDLRDDEMLIRLVKIRSALWR